MQNKRALQSPKTESSLEVATCAGNALPPTNFVDTLLANLFPENEPSTELDILAPFDYDGFLRKEGFA